LQTGFNWLHSHWDTGGTATRFRLVPGVGEPIPAVANAPREGRPVSQNALLLPHKLPVLFALERNPQVENEAFGDLGPIGKICLYSQVARQEQVTTENFRPDFRLTGEP
jgi:hypothetical protein